MRVKLLNLSDNENPSYKTKGSAGFDLAVADDTVIEAGEACLVRTGIHIEIPFGYEGQLRLRSSMYKKDIVMPNAPGTIDSDYRGEIKVPIRNLYCDGPVCLEKGERIAQLVIKKCPRVHLDFVSPDEFASCCHTERGARGFGSTGEK